MVKFLLHFKYSNIFTYNFVLIKLWLRGISIGSIIFFVPKFLQGVLHLFEINRIMKSTESCLFYQIPIGCTHIYIENPLILIFLYFFYFILFTAISPIFLYSFYIHLNQIRQNSVPLLLLQSVLSKNLSLL